MWRGRPKWSWYVVPPLARRAAACAAAEGAHRAPHVCAQLTGLTLASWVVLVLPLDIANTSVDGGLRIDVVWQMLYTTIAVWCIAVIPFAIFYYESEDPDSAKSPLYVALQWTVVTVAVALFVTFLMWGLAGEAEVPVARMQVASSSLYALDDVSYPMICEGAEVRSRAQRRGRVTGPPTPPRPIPVPPGCCPWRSASARTPCSPSASHRRCTSWR